VSKDHSASVAQRDGRDVKSQRNRERPSTHGAILGEALARLAESVTGSLPSGCCATCAFRRGCMTNQMASTGLVAFKCAVGADPDPFACHHGMKDGEPSKICAGWLACQLADFETVKEISAWLTARLAEHSDDAPDPIREAFDAWIAEIDPTGAMDDYQRGRLYLRRPLVSPPSARLGQSGPLQTLDEPND
jgi:hypothetical protein